MKDKLNLKLHLPYVDAINAYMDKFYSKHGYDRIDLFWVADCIGEICSVGDMYFNFSDIKYDIDNRINKKMLIEWYDYCLLHQKEKYKVNYKSYLMGFRYEDRKRSNKQK